MKTRRRAVPFAVKVLCAILILVPLIEGSVRHYQAHSFVPRYYKVPSDWVSLGCFALYACLAAGLAKGINWIRWCFVFAAALGLILEFMSSMNGMILVGSPPPFPVFIGLFIWTAHLAAVVLCLVPSTGAYFRKKDLLNQAADRMPGSNAPGEGGGH